MGYHFFMYHSWYTSNFESPNIFFDVILVSSYHGCKGENVKLIPYYMRYHLQNCKVITFENKY